MTLYRPLGLSNADWERLKANKRAREARERHWIVKGPGTGNLYAVGETAEDAITRALALLDECDRWRLQDKLTAREIENPR